MKFMWLITLTAVFKNLILMESSSQNGDLMVGMTASSKLQGKFQLTHLKRVVYVVDTVNARIQKFDSNGKFITKWGSFCTLTTVSGCIDPDGPGPLQKGDGQFDHPGDVELDSSGDVPYVTDSQNNRIQKFDSNGKFITKWGSSSVSDGQFSFPTGIAVDYLGINTYVVDSKNDRIQKFDSNGKFITKWGSQCNLSTGSGCIDPDGPGPLQKGDGQFNSPRGIFIDSTGKLVYVVDTANDRIQKFDSNGKFITKWGSTGSQRGQFNTAGGISGIGLASARLQGVCLLTLLVSLYTLLIKKMIMSRYLRELLLQILNIMALSILWLLLSSF